jgi:ABC-2 type transport system ATP-binding protein
MDEPMSGMDPLGRRLFRNLFKTLANQGVTIFFSTHIVEDIETLCDEIIVLANGKLRLQGTVGDIKKSYAQNLSLEEILYKDYSKGENEWI